MFLLMLGKNIIVLVVGPPVYIVWMLTMFDIAFVLVLLFSLADYFKARIKGNPCSLIWGEDDALTR